MIDKKSDSLQRIKKMNPFQGLIMECGISFREMTEKMQYHFHCIYLS